MDRFIVFPARQTLTLILTLKSNMDRFIAERECRRPTDKALKSNMDRFIALRCLLDLLELISLKSNMDRFIAL